MKVVIRNTFLTIENTDFLPAVRRAKSAPPVLTVTEVKDPNQTIDKEDFEEILKFALFMHSATNCFSFTEGLNTLLKHFREEPPSNRTWFPAAGWKRLNRVWRSMARSMSSNDIKYVCVYLPPQYFVIASNIIPSFTCHPAAFANFLERTSAERRHTLQYNRS
eukprot:10398099-Karenia_brevis.AAC.1